MTTQVRVFSFSSCTTCKRALSWLREHNVDFKLEDIVENPPSKDLLKKAIDQLGNRKLLFNTSGLSYRSLGASVVKSMSEQEALDALSKDGKLIKRPILISKTGKILVGFKQDAWEASLL